MKKLLTIICLIAFSGSMLAGWSTNRRSHCRWWAKRYAANAHVFSGTYTYQHNGDCGYAYAQAIKNCAWQKASRDSGGSWQAGAVLQSFCSRGGNISPMEQFVLPVSNSTVAGNIEESEISSKDEIFNDVTHSVELSGITGTIRLQRGNGFYSNFRISLWKPSDDQVNFVEDETMDASEVISQFEIRVTDQGVVFGGRLATAALTRQFVVTQTATNYYVTFQNISLVVPVPAALSMEDVALQLDGDAAPDSKKNVAKAIDRTDASVASKNFSFVASPNPTASVLNIGFSNNQADGQTVIELYDASGEKVKDVYNGFLAKEKMKNLEVDLSGLKNGKYFILIESNGERLVKQIVKD